MALNGEQVAAAAYIAGFRGNVLAQAVQVAWAESSWNPQAANSCCKGLWQINVQAHPGMAANVFDPVQNAKYAWQIYRAAGGWCSSGKPPNCNPWQGYGNSRYHEANQKSIAAVGSLMLDIQKGKTPQQILGSASQDSYGKVPAPVGSGVAGDVAGPLGGIIESINRLGTWWTSPDNLWRVLKVVGGVAVVLVGAGIIFERPIATNIVKMTPAGKALKTAGKVAKK